MPPLSLVLRRADILWDGVFEARDLSLHDGEIDDDFRGNSVDLKGYQVLPGIVDIHGDAFERQLAPRRGVITDLGSGLHALDAELAASGITTATLAQFWSWEGGMRSPEFARRLLRTLADAKYTLNTDMHVQLRFETHLLDDYEAIIETVEEFGVGYLVFNDHLPHRALDLDKRPPRLIGQALKGGRSPEAHLKLLRDLHARSDDVAPALERLIPALKTRGVLLGSHDDPTAVAREQWHAAGVGISEFPETSEAARSARGLGNGIVLGAPNAVRGGSHTGKLSAREAVVGGCCDALASDYHYPSLLQAVIALTDGDAQAFACTWRLVSSGPALLLGLADRGRLAPGMRADLVVYDPDARRIGATITGGRIAHLSGPVAERFLA
jgi:alpha-D-ribose 1-methylphosphonate 5-triphosphate diphosphatase